MFVERELVRLVMETVEVIERTAGGGFIQIVEWSMRLGNPSFCSVLFEFAAELGS